MREDGKGVSYEAFAQSELFKQYQASTVELMSVDIASLPKDEKIAFFLSECL